MLTKQTYNSTYIHNWPLQPFSCDYGLASHSNHVVCVNFIREWQDLQFNVDPERQIFVKLFHGRFIYSHSFCQISAERKVAEDFFHISFWCLSWDTTPGFTFNKSTHYLLDYDDFTYNNAAQFYSML